MEENRCGMSNLNRSVNLRGWGWAKEDPHRPQVLGFARIGLKRTRRRLFCPLRQRWCRRLRWRRSCLHSAGRSRGRSLGAGGHGSFWRHYCLWQVRACYTRSQQWWWSAGELRRQIPVKSLRWRSGHYFAVQLPWIGHCLRWPAKPVPRVCLSGACWYWLVWGSHDGLTIVRVMPTTASTGSRFVGFANPCWIGIYRFSVRLKQGTDQTHRVRHNT